MSEPPFTITAEEIELLREMRRLQQRFFDDKDRSVVGRAKAAERRVDKLLERYPDTTAPNLFQIPDPFMAPVGSHATRADEEADDDTGPWWAR